VQGCRHRPSRWEQRLDRHTSNQRRSAKEGPSLAGCSDGPRGSSVCGGRGAQAFRLHELELKRIPRWEDMSALTRIFWVFGSDTYKRGPCRGGPASPFWGNPSLPIGVVGGSNPIPGGWNLELGHGVAARVTSSCEVAKAPHISCWAVKLRCACHSQFPRNPCHARCSISRLLLRPVRLLGALYRSDRSPGQRRLLLPGFQRLGCPPRCWI
jgi:hypothetical protein